MMKTKIIAAAVAVGLGVVANPAFAQWVLNDYDAWVTEGIQTYTEGESYIKPYSAIFCGSTYLFYMAISSVDIRLAEPENDGFQSREISLRVKVDDGPTKVFEFMREVQNGGTYFYPKDPLFLLELQKGARLIQIEYPLSSGRVIHTYGNSRIDSSPCGIQ